MNKPKRECGSCMYWFKLPSLKDGRGICDYFDRTSYAQSGRNCKIWKGKKYDRLENKFQLKDELDEGL
jgi:hypothetical protein